MTTTGVVPSAVYASCTETMSGCEDLSVKPGSSFDLVDQRRGIGMERAALTQLTTEYIALWRQPKIDVFEKEAAERVKQGEDANAIAQERQELGARYLLRNWLIDAVRRAGQIKLVAHGAKFSYGDSKASSFYLETFVSEDYLSITSPMNAVIGTIGNAAALNVAKLL